jgi:hypothetical protein
MEPTCGFNHGDARGRQGPVPLRLVGREVERPDAFGHRVCGASALSRGEVAYGELMSRLTEVEPPAGEAALLVRAVVKLERLLDASDSFISGATEPAVPGSPMDEARKMGVRDPYDSANALIFSAEDHLRTVCHRDQAWSGAGICAIYALTRRG